MRNPGDDFQHLVSQDALSVRISERESNSGAGRRNGWITQLFQNPRAGHVPRIGEHENSRSVMQFPELLGLLGLHSHVHRGTSAENSFTLQEIKPRFCPSWCQRPNWRGNLLGKGSSPEDPLEILSP